MGQPEGEFSEYNSDQPQEYNQDNHYDASQAQDSAYTFATQGCYDPTQQNQPNDLNPSPNDPQPQQPGQGQFQPPPQPFQQKPQQPGPGQFQPPPQPFQQKPQQPGPGHFQPPPQPFQQQPQQPGPGQFQSPPQPFQQQPQQFQQPQHYPPQMNPGYGPQKGRPVQYPPQNTPMYQQQGRPAQPVQFPPQSPQANPMFGAQTYTHQAQPVHYNIPNSPIKPNGNVPAPGVPLQMTPQNQGWKTGLFDCMDDPTNALITAFFPCVTFGQVAEIVDNGNTSCGTSGMLYGLIAFCIAVPCIMSCSYRTKLRARFGLVESPAPDWITHFLCEYCALCQEYRELNLRGIDPSIGWQGNVARQMQQPQVAMVAPPNQTMMP